MASINVCSAAVADDDLWFVEELEADQQEEDGDEGQRRCEHSRACSLLNAKKSDHDDLEEEHCSDDVLEDLHPHLQQPRNKACHRPIECSNIKT